MNEKLKELAEQAGLSREFSVSGLWLSDDEELERFADLVRQDEREKCAKLCDNIDTPDGWSTSSLSASIRARGNHER